MCNKLKQIKGSEKFNISKKKLKNETSSLLALDKNSNYSYHYKPHNVFGSGFGNNYLNESNYFSNYNEDKKGLSL